MDSAEALADKRGLEGAAWDKAYDNYQTVFSNNLRKILVLVSNAPAASNSSDTLLWAANKNIFIGSHAASDGELQVLRLLTRYHAANPNVGQLCGRIGSYWKEHWSIAELTDFLRAISNENPDRVIRGQATLALARLSGQKAEDFVFVLNNSDPSTGTAAKMLLRQELKQLAVKADPKAAVQETERLLQEVITHYGDCPFIRPSSSTRPTETLGELASGELFAMQHLMLGDTIPEITGTDLDGHALKLSDYRGKVVVLTFWASWCAPCMAALPHERELASRFKDKPFAFVGVNGDEELAAAQQAVRNEKITWPSFSSDGDGPYGPIPTKWNVHGWPTVFILDAQGKIRMKFSGQNDAVLDETVNRLMAEQARPE